MALWQNVLLFCSLCNEGCFFFFFFFFRVPQHYSLIIDERKEWWKCHALKGDYFSANICSTGSACANLISVQSCMSTHFLSPRSPSEGFLHSSLAFEPWAASRAHRDLGSQRAPPPLDTRSIGSSSGPCLLPKHFTYLVSIHFHAAVDIFADGIWSD